MTLSAGTRLGPYEVLAKLGAGGMGEVYRARDTRLDREVAIKVLPERLAQDAGALARFEREAKVVASLSHPNILAIHDFGREGPVAYAVTELLEGETVADRLLQGPLPWRRAAEISIAVAEGLSAAHVKGIIHRDLKPQNLFLTTDDRVKILDFGLARRDQPISADDATAAPTQTGTMPGTVLGTVGYMSPEQVRGEPTDARTDLFAFGCLLYEMASGQRAFHRRTAADTMAAVLNEGPAEAPVQNLPLGLRHLILRSLEKNPQTRFQSAHDLAFALKELLRTPSGEMPLSSGSHRRPLESLAVLPFANASGDADAEYLSDGIADTIIQTLSRLPNLRVMARSTLSRYRGVDVDPRLVGTELRVGAVLTGRVLHRGESLVVKAELVDARDGSQIWGETYNRRLEDLLALEADISREISEKLRLKITGEEVDRLARRSTESPAAHRLYLRGRFFLEKRSAESLRKAIEHFQQAIEEDPEYALAYAGIAECYDFQGFYGYRSPNESFPKAKAAANRALELDATIPEAYAARGVARFYYDWDVPGAEADYLKAIAAGPSYANARQYHAVLLAAVSRFDESFAEVGRAEELDPLSLPIKTTASWTRLLSRRFDEAVERLEAAIEMDPSFVPVRNVLTWAYLSKGDHARALEEGRTISGRGTNFLATFGVACAAAGRRTDADAVLRELEEISRQSYVSQVHVCFVHAWLGDAERAFQALDRAVRERDWNLIMLDVDPRADPLRADSRFEDVLRRVGLRA